MQRFERPTKAAVGEFLAHTLKTPQGVIKKGRQLQQQDINRLIAAGIEQIQIIRLSTGDLHENSAAIRLANEIKNRDLLIDQAEAGRCNLIASQRGLLQLDEAVIHDLNSLHESITLATLPHWSVVEQGQVVACIKIIPFAVDAALCDQWITRLDEAAPVKVQPFNALPVALLRTHSHETSIQTGDKFEQLTARRLAYYGCVLTETEQCLHSEAAITKKLETLKSRCNLILLAGHSVTLDREDVVPRALQQAGGKILRFGLPVEPGNMLLYGTLDNTTLINLPGCAKSPALNGLDLLLPRLAAGIPFTQDDLSQLGIGGLLRHQRGEFTQQSLRPVAKNILPTESAKQLNITALVLAAGRSKRMGCNKLLIPLNGRPMIQHTLDALSGDAISSITLVTGHQPEQLNNALHNHSLFPQLRIIQNPDYANGLASSLRLGLKHLPANRDGLLVMLGDLPQLTPELIEQLLARFRELNGEKIIMPCYQGKRGNPRLWPARLIPLMSLAQGDRGADFLIRQNPSWVEEIVVDDPAVIHDFDTPEAVAQWKA